MYPQTEVCTSHHCHARTCVLLTCLFTLSQNAVQELTLCSAAHTLPGGKGALVIMVVCVGLGALYCVFFTLVFFFHASLLSVHLFLSLFLKSGTLLACACCCFRLTGVPLRQVR